MQFAGAPIREAVSRAWEYENGDIRLVASPIIPKTEIYAFEMEEKNDPSSHVSFLVSRLSYIPPALLPKIMAVQHQLGVRQRYWAQEPIGRIDRVVLIDVGLWTNRIRRNSMNQPPWSNGTRTRDKAGDGDD
eukprot:scaffold3097_cov130-Cylindrotheca_fusiformis.AAC.2